MIIDNIRDKEEFEKLYNSCNRDDKLRTLEQLQGFFDHRCGYCFYDENNGKLYGCIYLELINGKIYLHGFSCRKNYHRNIEALNFICDKLEQDVYSETSVKSAIMLLKSVGFEKVKDNLYVRRYNNGRQ